MSSPVFHSQDSAHHSILKHSEREIARKSEETKTPVLTEMTTLGAAGLDLHDVSPQPKAHAQKAEHATEKGTTTRRST